MIQRIFGGMDEKPNRPCGLGSGDISMSIRFLRGPRSILHRDFYFPVDDVDGSTPAAVRPIHERPRRNRPRPSRDDGLATTLRVRSKGLSPLGPSREQTREDIPVDDYVARLKKAVIEYDMEGMPALAKEALDRGMDPLQGIEKGLAAGIREVGQKFGAGELFLPELVMAAETMRTGVAILEPHV